MKIGLYTKEGTIVDIEIKENEVTFTVPLKGAAQMAKGYSETEGETFEPHGVVKEALYLLAAASWNYK